MEIPRQHRNEIGVDRRRGGALVLPKLRRDLVGHDDVGTWQPPSQLVRDRELVGRVAEREEQADGDRLRVDLWQRPQIQGLDNTVRPDPLSHAVAALERHERRRMVSTESIQMRAVLAAQMQQLLESGGRDKGRPGSLAFEERVRRDRRPVRETFDLSRADGSRGSDD
jgi:hypothetical protein